MARYKEAMAVATTDLVVTHPIRLGLALNFSVFHYEVLGNPEEACKMARQAFEDAIAELDSVSEDSYKVPSRETMARGSWSLRIRVWVVMTCSEPRKRAGGHNFISLPVR